jgi:Lhr-like helicase
MSSIDEVHLLGEPRGAVMERAIARTRLFNPTLRIIALSATIANADDVAAWIGGNSDKAPVVGFIFLHRATRLLIDNLQQYKNFLGSKYRLTPLVK